MIRPLSVVSLLFASALAAPALADDVRSGAAPSAGVAFEPGPPAFADVLAKAKAEGKPIFLDFDAKGCGWCRKLEKETFSQGSVGDAMRAFINVHIDVEEGEGEELAKRFNVHGYPTLVVLDSSGAEVDRIGGYMPPEPFVKEIRRIQS